MRRAAVSRQIRAILHSLRAFHIRSLLFLTFPQEKEAEAELATFLSRLFLRALPRWLFAPANSPAL
jgi:hypothetical protein